MKNEYRIIDYRDLGLPGVEVHGDQFHYQDLYELVGKNQFMTTFELKEGSESYNEYGGSVLGVIYYDRKALDALGEFCNSRIKKTKTKVRIDSLSRELTREKRGDLKYSGINVHDIASISFLPYKRHQNDSQ